MPAPDLSGKIALVTGASRGIGAAVAKGLAAHGAHVILAARTVGALEEVDDAIQSVGGQASILAMDLGKLNDVDKIGPTIAERFGALDIFIGNAGMLGPLSPVGHVRPLDWEKVFKLNFHSNVRLIRTLDPILRQSPAGRVVFTTTHLAEEAHAYWGPYAASKAALDSFIRVYASENDNTSIRVNGIRPGAVDTEMLKDAFPGGPEFPTKKPEDVVPAFLDLCDTECIHNGDIIALD